MNNNKNKLTIYPRYLRSNPGSSMIDVSHENQKVELCDMIFLGKDTVTAGNGNISNLEKMLTDKMNVWLKKTHPQYKWFYKKSATGNYVFWKDEEVFLDTKSNLLVASRKNKTQYSAGYYDDSYDDVALCDEFSRDELDPDLAESWDESYRSTY